ncbi:unnamed protein product [Heligmosomoides polygyrus]|uniref:Uncharacterized protein n=1 Tax=Heligmosomoides polygyrus TaxID=6339 RepID=A0A183FHB4_HELPZ|nr:unnamed protein product [Heligmosomoides polygyrus]
MLVHSVRGCVHDCADCNCVGPAKSLHSVDWEYIVRRFGAASKVSPRPFGQSGWLPGSNTAALKGLIPLNPKEPHFCSDGKDEYGEAAKMSEPNQAAQIEKDWDDYPYLQRVHSCVGSIRRGPDDASQEDQVRRHWTDRDEKTPPLHAAYDSAEELYLGTCDSRELGGVGVLDNTHLAMNIEQEETSGMESF